MNLKNDKLINNTKILWRKLGQFGQILECLLETKSLWIGVSLESLKNKGHEKTLSEKSFVLPNTFFLFNTIYESRNQSATTAKIGLFLRELVHREAYFRGLMVYSFLNKEITQTFENLNSTQTLVKTLDKSNSFTCPFRAKITEIYI